MKIQSLTKRSIFIIASLTFFLSCATETKYLVKKPFLYEVKKGDKTGYLFGTMHAGIAVDDLPESFWPYFNTSDIFVAEIDPEEMTHFQELLKQKVDRDENEPKAITEFNETEIKQIKSLINDKSADFIVANMSFYAIKSSIIYSLTKDRSTQVSRGEYIRFMKKFSLDLGLTEIATKKQKKTFDYLDKKNSNSLVTCFAGTWQKNRDDIRLILKNQYNLNIIPELLVMMETYRNGEESAMIPYFKGGDACLLKERNEYWMFKIKSVLENYNQPFIAVGLAHIIDKKDSLRILLKKEGYQVNRVTDKDQK